MSQLPQLLMSDVSHSPSASHNSPVPTAKQDGRVSPFEGHSAEDTATRQRLQLAPASHCESESVVGAKVLGAAHISNPSAVHSESVFQVMDDPAGTVTPSGPSGPQ